MTQHAELLKKVPLFENVDDAELGRISQMLVEKGYSKDATIVAKDEPGDAMYIIARGRVKVVMPGDGGREVILNILKAGDFFGEMALVEKDSPRSADVVSAEDTRVLVLKREVFVDHVLQSPKIALNIMSELSRRLRRADELISDLALLDVGARIARIIFELGERDGVDTEEGRVVRERPTQQDIASMIGTSRETVSRMLSDWQRAGLIEMRGRELVLKHKFKMQRS